MVYAIDPAEAQIPSAEQLAQLPPAPATTDPAAAPTQGPFSIDPTDIKIPGDPKSDPALVERKLPPYVPDPSLPPDVPKRFSDREPWAYKEAVKNHGWNPDMAPADMMREAQRLMSGTAQDFVLTLDEIVPFSPVRPMMYTPEYHERANRVLADMESSNPNERRADWSDYLYVAGQMEADRGKMEEGIGWKIGNVLRGTTKFGTEIAILSRITGPAGIAARAKILESAASAGLKGRRISQMAKAISGATEIAMKGAGVSITRDSFQNRLYQGKPVGRAAAEALADGITSVAVEHLGGFIDRSGVMKAMKQYLGLKRVGVARKLGRIHFDTWTDYYNAIRKPAQFHSIIGEELEEIAEELGKPAMGLEEWQGASRDVYEGRYGDAIEKIGVNMAAFAILGLPGQIAEARDAAMFRMMDVAEDKAKVAAKQQQQQAQPPVVAKQPQQMEPARHVWEGDVGDWPGTKVAVDDTIEGEFTKTSTAGDLPPGQSKTGLNAPAQPAQPTLEGPAVASNGPAVALPSPPTPMLPPPRKTTKERMSELFGYAKDTILNRGAGLGVGRLDDAEMDALEAWAGVKNGNWENKRAVAKTQNAIRKYLNNEGAVPPGLESAFAKFRGWANTFDPNRPAPTFGPAEEVQVESGQSIDSLDAESFVKAQPNDAREFLEEWTRTGIPPSLERFEQVTGLTGNRDQRHQALRRMETHMPEIRLAHLNERLKEAEAEVEKYEKEHQYVGGRVVNGKIVLGGSLEANTRWNKAIRKQMKEDKEYQALKKRISTIRGQRQAFENVIDSRRRHAEIVEKAAKGDYQNGEAFLHVAPEDIHPVLHEQLRQFAIVQMNSLKLSPKMMDDLARVVSGSDNSMSAGRARSRLFRQLIGAQKVTAKLGAGYSRTALLFNGNSVEEKTKILKNAFKEWAELEANGYFYGEGVTTRIEAAINKMARNGNPLHFFRLAYIRETNDPIANYEDFLEDFNRLSEMLGSAYRAPLAKNDYSEAEESVPFDPAEIEALKTEDDPYDRELLPDQYTPVGDKTDAEWEDLNLDFRKANSPQTSAERNHPDRDIRASYAEKRRAKVRDVMNRIWNRQNNSYHRPVDPAVDLPNRSEADISGKKGSIALWEIRDRLANIANMMIPGRRFFTGRAKEFTRPKNPALGFYNRVVGIVRTFKYSDLPTLAHEFAHLMDYVLHVPSQYAHAFDENRMQFIGHEPPSYMNNMPPAAEAQLLTYAPGYGKGLVTEYRESFANFFMDWVAGDQAKLASKAELVKWFETEYFKDHPKILAELKKARDAFVQYQEQGDIKRGLSRFVDPLSWKWLWRKFKQNVMVRDYWTFHAFDRLASLNNLLVKPLELIHGKLPLDRNPYALRTAFSQTADAFVKQAMESHMTDLFGVVRDDVHPLKHLEKLIPTDKQDLFMLFLHARATEWYGVDRVFQYRDMAGNVRTKTRPARDTGMPVDEATWLMAWFTKNHPEFLQAGLLIDKWNHAIMDMLRQSSLEGRAIADRIEKAQGWDEQTGQLPVWVPLQRIFPDKSDNVNWRKQQGNPLESTGTYKKMKGSGYPLKNILEQIVNQAVTKVRFAQEMRVKAALMELVKMPGFGHVAHRLDRPLELKYKTTLAEVVSKVPEKAFTIRDDLYNDFRPLLEALGLQVDVAENRELEFWGMAARPFGIENVMPIFDAASGELQFWWVNPDVYAALYQSPATAFNAEGGVSHIAKMLNWFKRIKVVGTTGLRPAFAIWNNPAVDFWTFFLNNAAGQDINPLRHPVQAFTQTLSAVSVWAGMLYESAAHTVWERTGGKRGKESDAINFIKNHGLIKTSLAREDSLVQRAAVRGMFRRSWKAKFLDVTHYPSMLAGILETITDTLQFTESASRAANLKIVAKQIGYDWKDPSKNTESQHIAMMLAAKSVTLDHTNGGYTTVLLNQFIPFFRSQFASWRSANEAMQRNPYMYFFRCLQIMGMTTAYWLMYKDDDWYREAGDIKYHYWMFPTPKFLGGDPGKGKGEMLMLRRPYDVGYLFSSAWEAILDSAYQRDPYGAATMAIDFVDTHVPFANLRGMSRSSEPLLELMYGPLYEIPLAGSLFQVAMNKSAFTGRDIVPPSLENRPPGLRFTKYTPEVFKVAGKILSFSPAKMEFLSDELFGPAFGDMVSSFDKLIAPGKKTRAVKRPLELSELIPFGLGSAMFRRGGAYGTQPESVRELYRLRTQMEERKAVETPAQRAERLTVTDAINAVKAYMDLREYASTIEQERQLGIAAGRVARDAIESVQNYRRALENASR